MVNQPYTFACIFLVSLSQNARFKLLTGKEQYCCFKNKIHKYKKKNKISQHLIYEEKGTSAVV